LDKNKRFLEVFLKMNKEKKRTMRLKSVARMQDRELPKTTKDADTHFFRIGAICPRKRV
jgi:hypothetical protein